MPLLHRESVRGDRHPDAGRGRRGAELSSGTRMNRRGRSGDQEYPQAQLWILEFGFQISIVVRRTVPVWQVCPESALQRGGNWHEYRRGVPCR